MSAATVVMLIVFVRRERGLGDHSRFRRVVSVVGADERGCCGRSFGHAVTEHGRRNKMTFVDVVVVMVVVLVGESVAILKNDRIERRRYRRNHRRGRRR